MDKGVRFDVSTFSALVCYHVMSGLSFYAGAIHALQTCKNLIDRAFVACDSGIVQAQAKCLGVMGELGNVYHHARDVLDRINPERWAGARGGEPPSPQQQQVPPLLSPLDVRPGRRRRQIPPGFGDDVGPRQRCQDILLLLAKC